MPHHDSPVVIDLFAGCGGLSLGLEQAGFHPVAFSEINKDAAETYRANRTNLPELLVYHDVSTLADKEVRRIKSEFGRDGEIDLVCGGPPCQGYSGIGHRRSYKVDREEIPSNHLFKEMIRVIRAAKPKMFLFENVRGLLSGRWTAGGTKGEIWQDVLGSFLALRGYHVRHALVQAKDYGVPQNRPRVLVIGVRKDLGIDPDPVPDAIEAGLLPGRTAAPPNLEDVLEDLIDPDYREKGETTQYIGPATTPFQREMRSRGGRVARVGDPLTEQLYSNHSEKIRAKFEWMLKNNGEIPPEFQTKKFAQRVLPRVWNGSGPNITATSLADDFVHYAQPRTLTVREWARLQCFPDWYEFAGPRTTGGVRRAGVPTEGVWDREVPKYTQIGNAVPVRLARAVGEHLMKLLP